MAAQKRVVVVGTGPCGAVAARELAAAGVDVLVLESGSKRPPGALVRLGGTTFVRRAPAPTLTSTTGHVAMGDPRTQWYYDLAPGGLSNHWTAAVPRFDPHDFDEGAVLGPAYRWPIGYDDLAPAYAAVERLLLVSGSSRPVPHLPPPVVRYERTLPADWRPVADVAARMGHGLTVMPMARGRRWMAVRRGTEFNSFANVVEPLLSRPNVRLVTGAHVTRLLCEGGRGGVTEVELLDRDTGARSTVPADAVVLAAGALQSTKILLSSASSDFPDGLGNSRGVVGRYLHDHPRDWWPVALDHPLTLPSHPLYLTRGDEDEVAPLSGTSWTIGLAGPRDRWRAVAGRPGRQLGVQVFGTMVPRPEHCVTLAEAATDELGLARLEIDTSYDAATVASMWHARQRFAEVLAAAGISSVPNEDPMELEPGSSVHFGGTLRMHHDPEFGVADAWNRLHDVPNVVVADSACFTTGPEKNPTVTAMALAWRAARHLGDELAGGGRP